VCKQAHLLHVSGNCIAIYHLLTHFVATEATTLDSSSSRIVEEMIKEARREMKVKLLFCEDFFSILKHSTFARCWEFYLLYLFRMSQRHGIAQAIQPVTCPFVQFFNSRRLAFPQQHL